MTDFQKIESELLSAIEQFATQGLPESDVRSAVELTKAGEPGVALENLCSQLFEHDMAVSDTQRALLQNLADQMSVESSYWSVLRRA